MEHSAGATLTWSSPQTTSFGDHPTLGVHSPGRMRPRFTEMQAGSRFAYADSSSREPNSCVCWNDDAKNIGIGASSFPVETVGSCRGWEGCALFSGENGGSICNCGTPLTLSGVQATAAQANSCPP